MDDSADIRDAGKASGSLPPRRVASLGAIVVYLVSFVVYNETEPSLVGAILVLCGLCAAFGVVVWSAAPQTNQQKAVFAAAGIVGLALNGHILLGPVL